MSDYALFAIGPFVSLAVLLVAATSRALHDNSVRVWPSPLLGAARRLAGNHPLLTIGLLGVLLGHAMMVGWPDQLLRWNRDLSRLIAFEVVLFAFGTAALVGVCAAIGRRVLARTAGAGLADTAFLGVLLLTLVSGLAVAVVYRWAAAWSAITVTRYSRSLLSLMPNVEPLEAMPYLVKLHIFSSFVGLALLAFTPYIDVLLSGLHRAAGIALNPFVSTFDRQWRPLQEWALRSGRSLMWPEDED